MRILADENVDRPIAEWLRAQGHDVAEATTMAQGAADADLISMSRREGRILMTFDRDIGRLVQSDFAPHPGVVYLRLREPGRSRDAFRDRGGASVNASNAPKDTQPDGYPEWYYELLARTMGEAKADWARLPRREREAELTLLHRSFDTPDDLSVWPAELDGGADRP